jgi:hypothetical protein
MAEDDTNSVKYEALFHAIDGFVRANCNFESSIPVNAAIDDMVKLNNLQEIFAIPLQRQLFNFDTAVKWVFFLSVVPTRAQEEGDEMIANLGEFSSKEAFNLIAQVYDIGTQENIWVHFDYDDEEDEEDEAEDDEEES